MAAIAAADGRFLQARSGPGRHPGRAPTDVDSTAKLMAAFACFVGSTTMKTFALSGLAVSLVLLGATVGAARAEDTFGTDAATCAGVYGALGDTRERLTATFPAFKDTNFAQIDYAGRRAKLIGSDDATKAGALAFEVEFKKRLVGDIIDGKATHIGEVLKVQVHCDFAHNLMPTFTPPAKKN
jgi:hypothetical protein